MSLVEYEYDALRQSQYLRLMDQLYGSDAAAAGYRQSLGLLLAPDHPLVRHQRRRQWNAYAGEECLGHCMAMIDRRLPGIGLVGFFEATSAGAAAALLERAVAWLREQGATEARGPINGSIWHSYRCSDATEPLFLGDICSQPAYAGYFAAAGFAVAEHYISGHRTDVDPIVAYSRPKYEVALAAGYTIRPLDIGAVDRELRIVHSLALEIFNNSWSFVPLDEAEFFSMYRPALSLLSEHYCHFVCADNEPIGFSFSFLDPTARQKTLVMKTIGVLPAYQRHNLGSALIHLQHQQAQADNVAAVIYALMRTGNVASNINPYDAEVIRSYEAYSRSLT